MHTAYRVYSLVCCINFALCVMILSLGYQPRALVLQLSNNDLFQCSSWNTTLWMERHNLPLSSTYFLAEMTSSIFSVFYLHLQEINTEDTSQQEILADLLFWCFLFTQIYTSVGLQTMIQATADQLILRIVLHFGTLFLICSPIEKRRGPDISTSLGLVIFMGLAFISISMTCSQATLVLSYLQRFLDLLLIVGHRWDSEPTVEVLLNNRLFNVALSGTLLHLDVVFGPTML